MTDTTQIYLPVYPDAKMQWCWLYENPKPEDLGQDLVWIELANGYSVDVDWFSDDPDHRWLDESGGTYYINMINDNDWENPLEERTAKTAKEVVEIVVALVEKYRAL